MSTTGWNGPRWRWLIALVVVLFLGAIVSLMYFHTWPVKDHGDRFQVPLADKMAMDGIGQQVVPSGQLMTLDPTRRFLINSSTLLPVFITGDSASSLQVQLSDSDIQRYLSDRGSRGFNLIWVDLADNYYSNHAPKDFYGNAPFNGADFTNPNPAYWARVDQTLSWAATYGITVLADPAFVGADCKGGYCESYRNSSADVLTAYGRFLGHRYKGFPNIIWLIGGDADPRDSNVQSKLYALAKGIKSTDTVHLMTTENYRGISSEDIWSEAPWLDLDALYLRPEDIPAKANADFLAATHPVFMMEDLYEEPITITELAVRREGYWAVLSGSTLGRIFGNYAIWNFDWPPDTTDPWKDQLGSPGSTGQAWLGKLFRSREHWKLVPDATHSVMTDGYDSRDFISSAREHVRRNVYGRLPRSVDSLSVAARTSDGQTIIAYVPNGNAATITIDMSRVTDVASQTKCWWFNPRDGSTALIGIFPASGAHNFTPPDADDWVLVIDGLSANLPAPGSADYTAHSARSGETPTTVGAR